MHYMAWKNPFIRPRKSQNILMHFLHVTVFAKRAHFGATSDSELCIWSESTLLPLYNALYCASLAASVFKICLRREEWRELRFEKRCLPIYFRWKPQYSAFCRVTNDVIANMASLSMASPGQVVGHVPRSLAQYTHFSFHRQGNQIVCEVTGSPVNRGVGLGLDVPCFYHFDWYQNFIRKLWDSLRE